MSLIAKLATVYANPTKEEAETLAALIGIVDAPKNVRMEEICDSALPNDLKKASLQSMLPAKVMFSPTKKPKAKTSPDQVFWANLAAAVLDHNVLTLKNAYFFGSTAMGSQVFVRNCYNALWDLINANWSDGKNTLLLGTPGIGKSTFLAYILYRLRKQTVHVVLWRRGETCKLYKADGQVEEGNFEDFSQECANPDTYLLTDGCLPPEDGTAAKILEVSSPRKEFWLTFQKRRTTTTLYMPTWSLDELLQCAKQCYSDMKPADVIRKFKSYGGSARHVLAKSDAEATKAIDDALARTNVLEAIESNGKSGAPEDVSSIILHWTVKDFGKTIADEVQAYNDYECEFASEAVRMRVIEEHGKVLESQLRNFVMHSEGNIYYGQLRGRLFEDLAHKRLQEGGTFTIRCLSKKKSQNSLLLTQSRLKDLLSVDDIPQSAEVDTYCKPVASNFGAVDSLLIGPDDPTLFQMMTGKRHGVVVSKLNAILDKLDKSDSVDIYFVTPDVGAHLIKAQPYMEASKVVENPDFGETEVVQWVLELPLHESKRKAPTQDVDDS